MTGRRLTIDADVLLRQLQRNNKSFDAMIFWRDVQEIGLALVMAPLWLWIGLKAALPWMWYLCIPALLWVAGFMTVDRIRQRARLPKPSEPLRACAEASLAKVQHQIWLLRNVFWWYLLPPGLAVGAFFAQCAWNIQDLGWLAVLILAGFLTFEVAVLWGVYWLNTTAVREDLGPRRDELLALLRNLDTELR